jgi:hypothetical protein
MPYIKQEDREQFEEDSKGGYIDLLNEVGFKCDNAGDLNYVFTRIAHKYITEKGLRYQYLNDIIGALEGCKLELYRKIAAPYENEKIAENGDVLPENLVKKGY